MPTTKPFAYNTGGPISGTTQYGNLVSGNVDVDYSLDYAGLKWWMGPEEDTGYVIGTSVPAGNQPVPSGVTGSGTVEFWRTKVKTDQAFLDLANYIAAKNGHPPFANTNDAEIWLESNGYYTSFNLPTPTPTPTAQSTPTPSATNTETPTPTPTFTPTPSATDLSSITTYTISGCSTLNVFVADLGPGALAPSDVFYFDFTGGTPSGCYTIIEKTNSAPSDGTTPLYFYPNCSLCLAANTTPTPTPTVTQTPTNSPTVSPTQTTTNTETPTPTPTITSTVTPTNTETPTPTPTNTTTPTPTTTPIPKFRIFNNSTGNRTITQVTGGGFWNLTSGSYPVAAGQNGLGLTHPSLTFLGLDQLAILFGGSDAIDLTVTKNGSPYTAASSVPTTNITASQINFFVNNPSDTIQSNDLIIITITDTI